MSAAAASSTEPVTSTVRFLDEGVDVWRPVAAHRVRPATFRIVPDPVPTGETWSHAPGEIVVAEARDQAGRPC